MCTKLLKTVVSAVLKAKKTEYTSNVKACSYVKPSISCEEMMRLKVLMVALRGDLSGPLHGFLRKYGLLSSNKETIEGVFGLFGDSTLLEIKRIMKDCLGKNIEKGNKNHVNTQRTKETM